MAKDFWTFCGLFISMPQICPITLRIGYRIGANTDTDGSAVVPAVEKEMVVYSDVHADSWPKCGVILIL